MIKSETKKKFSLKSLKIMPYVAGSIVAILVALCLILIFALVIRYANVSDKLITPVNIVIKILSIGLGTFIATKDGTKGLLKGSIIGVNFVILCQLIYTIISGKICLGISFLIDLAIGVAIGVISGILFVNLRKS